MVDEPIRGEIAQILSDAKGKPHAGRELFPLVYNELRKLAQWKLAHELPGQTLTATSLVHEAYLRLVGRNPEQPWDGRAHFFSAAAESMRRILVENARHKRRLKHGGTLKRSDQRPDEVAAREASDDVLAVDEALARLAEVEPEAVKLVELRYFAGLTIPQAADVLGIGPRSADRLWSYARAWLRREIRR
jgi:RNA polymerase sigma factor (TIGR02999 family)